MRVSLEWLKELVDLGDISPVEVFSRAGMEVEEVLLIDGDTVFDVETSPVRGDLLGMWGVAREIAVFLEKDLVFPPFVVTHNGLEEINIKIEEPDSCPRYSCGVVRGLERRDTPLWIKKRLRAMDCSTQNRPIDIGNYVMYETGQPVHLFDLNTISGNILIRSSRKGEVIETLDGRLRTLPEGILLICDGETPIAVAGITGENRTKLKEESKDVLVESGCFDPITIRRGSRKLGISTGASYRFERGGDVEMTEIALQRVMLLLKEYYGGRPEARVDRYPDGTKKRFVSISSQTVNRVLGSSLSDSELLASCKRLGFTIKDKKVEIPSYRRDITDEIDLVEEVARILGYDRLLPQMPYPVVVENEESLEKRARDGMIRLGFNEVYTLPLTKCGNARLINWMREDHSVLRGDMIEGLLSTLSRNRAYGTNDVRIFELGKVFGWDGKVTTESRLTAVMAGEMGRTLLWRYQDVDFFDMKGIVEALFEIMKITKWTVVPFADGHPQALPLHNYRHGSVIKQGEVVLGQLGRFNSKLLKRMEIDFPVYGVEIEISKLIPEKWSSYRPISRFPAMMRDISIIIDRKVSAGSILEFINNNSPHSLEDVRIFDYYTGEGIGKDKVALGLRLSFREKEGTLERSDVDILLSSIIDDLSKKYSAVLRDSRWTS